MPQEIDLIEDFLVERTDFSRVISKEKFACLFPKSTDEHIINRIYFYLNKSNRMRFDKIIKNIENFCQSLKELKFKHDTIDTNLDIKEINTKLDALSSILDSELIQEEERYAKNKNRLQSQNDDLKEVLSLIEQTDVQELLNLLDEFYALTS